MFPRIFSSFSVLQVMSENVEPETKDSALMESVTAEGETVVPMESSLDIGDGAVEMATETVIRDVEPAIPDVIPVQKVLKANRYH